MTEKDKKILCVNILECDKPTGNGRVYCKDMMKEAVEKASKKKVFVYCGQAVSRSLEHVAGMADVYMDEDIVYADVELLDTKEGNKLKDIVEKVRSPYSVSFKTGGFGKVDEDGNVYDCEFKHVSVDMVRDEKDGGSE